MMNEMNYEDIVKTVHESIKDVCDENECDFDMALEIYLEGLRDDVCHVERNAEKA